MSRLDQFDIGVSVDGVDLGTFGKMSGGEVDSEETTYKPGAMGARVSLGGSQNIGVITLSRLYDLTRDHLQVHWLLTRAGKGWVRSARVARRIQRELRAVAQRQGSCKMVKPRTPDSTSSTERCWISEVTPTGTVA